MAPLNQTSDPLLLPDEAQTPPPNGGQSPPNGVPEVSSRGGILLKDTGGIRVGGTNGRHPFMTAPLNSFEGYMRTWRNAAPSTIARYKSGLRFLERATGKPFTTDLDEKLTKQDVIDAVTHSTYLKPESHAAVISSAKAWEKAGNFLGWWDRTEIQELSFSVPKGDPKPPLTLKQVHRVWACCHTSRDFRLVALGLYAGTRIGEAEAMDKECWLEDRLRFRSSKTRRQIDVPLHPELARLKDVILNDSDLPQFALKSTARHLRDRAGFEFTSHAFRRTFSQQLIDAGVPVWVVDDLTGHRPRSMTFGAYAIVPWDDKVVAIDKLAY